MTDAGVQVFSFDITLRLPDNAPDPEQHVDALCEAGCDDGLPGVGLAGFISMAFEREAANAEAAMFSALQDMMRAIPGAVFVEAKPDLVSFKDIATLYGCSRQNVRKHLFDKAGVPLPAHMGSPALWHLAEVGDYLNRAMKTGVSADVVDTARVAQMLNTRHRGRVFTPDTELAANSV